MKRIITILLLASGCRGSNEKAMPENQITSIDSAAKVDNTAVNNPISDTASQSSVPYSNDRFKEVALRKLSADSAKVTGKARIFEATLSYAIYENGKQVYQGFHTASAGAPEWGNFDFNIAIPRSAGDTEAYLMLYESSAKDGSRVGILKIPF